MTASNDTRCNEKLQLVKRYRIVDIPMKYDPRAVFVFMSKSLLLFPKHWLEDFSSNIKRLWQFGKCYEFLKRNNLQNIISGSIIEILSYHDV